MPSVQYGEEVVGMPVVIYTEDDGKQAATAVIKGYKAANHKHNVQHDAGELVDVDLRKVSWKLWQSKPHARFFPEPTVSDAGFGMALKGALLFLSKESTCLDCPGVFDLMIFIWSLEKACG